MNIKRLRALKGFLIGGGLIMVLLLWLCLKTTAFIGYSEGEFKIFTEIHVELDFDGEPQKSSYISDINGDGEIESVVLENGLFSIYRNDQKIFETDPSWKVEGFIVGDFNNDEENDLGLYLWKTGSYGTSKPFWIKENDTSYKQHLFLYKWDEKSDEKGVELKPLWHSSNLPYINTETFLEDLDKDGKNELIVLEKPYDYFLWQGAKNVAVWRWDEWGFKNIWRSADGKFDDLEVSK